ncbi:MAG: T9SS type A sorting domain-containing protein [candidate division WOR-3 bacterium]
MRRALVCAVIGGFTLAASGQPVVLSQNVLDDGGRVMLFSSGYRCGFSLGQPVASGWLRSQAYRAVLGFWCRPFAMGGVSGNQVEPLRAADVSFEPCWPNPFDRVTHVSYVLPTETSVSLAVYDRKGSLVGTLVRGRQAAGRYLVTWNIRAVSESSLPSGVYFLELLAGQTRLVQKVVITR